MLRVEKEQKLEKMRGITSESAAALLVDVMAKN